MASPDFVDRLRAIQDQKQSVLCVGLDPDPERIPPHLLKNGDVAGAIGRFNAALIEATRSAACAYKLNFAFYEALGLDGWKLLEATIRQLPDDVLVVADAKRGDIGNTARFYAESAFVHLGCDACTVAPYMGRDAVAPFLQYAGKAAFVLGRTSNPSAADFQERILDGEPLYRQVARRVAAWNDELPGTAGLVVGATSPEALRDLRGMCPALPFLIPGVGAQGGDARAVMQAAATPDGLVLVNSSRQILYASSGPDFADAAEHEAAALRDSLRSLG